MATKLRPDRGVPSGDRSVGTRLRARPESNSRGAGREDLAGVVCRLAGRGRRSGEKPAQTRLGGPRSRKAAARRALQKGVGFEWSRWARITARTEVVLSGC